MMWGSVKVLFIKSWEIEHHCMLGRSISSRKGEDGNVEETLLSCG